MPSDRPEIHSRRTGTRTIRLTDYQFIDLRRFGDEVTRLIESRVRRLCSAAAGVERIAPGAEAWRVDGAVGGSIAPCTDTGAKLTDGQLDAIRNHMAERYADSVSEVWASLHTRKATLAPDHLHLVTVHWEVTVADDVLDLGGAACAVTAIVDATAQQSVQTCVTEADLAPEARAAFDARLNYLALAG